MSKINRNYAIVDNEGFFLTGNGVYGTNRHIILLSKEDAQSYIFGYSPNCTIKKMKVKEER